MRQVESNATWSIARGILQTLNRLELYDKIISPREVLQALGIRRKQGSRDE